MDNKSLYCLISLANFRLNYVWIYENEAKGLKLLTKRASEFFSPETISTGDDIKMKRIVIPFSLPLPLYLAFTAVLSLFLARLHGLKAA